MTCGITHGEPTVGSALDQVLGEWKKRLLLQLSLLENVESQVAPCANCTWKQARENALTALHAIDRILYTSDFLEAYPCPEDLCQLAWRIIRPALSPFTPHRFRASGEGTPRSAKRSELLCIFLQSFLHGHELLGAAGIFKSTLQSNGKNYRHHLILQLSQPLEEDNRLSAEQQTSLGWFLTHGYTCTRSAFQERIMGQTLEFLRSAAIEQ